MKIHKNACCSWVFHNLPTTFICIYFILEPYQHALYKVHALIYEDALNVRKYVHAIVFEHINKF